MLQLGQAETRLFSGTRSGFDEVTSLGSLDIRTTLAHHHFELVEAVVEEPRPHEQLGTAAAAVLDHAGSAFTIPAQRLPKDTTTVALLRT